MRRAWFMTMMVLVFPLWGEDLGGAVARLEEPTVEQARVVIADLDRLIAGGDARTVTLAKKMRRSVRRIFVTEHKVREARARAEELEAKAQQLDRNGKNWLKPDIHGRINKIAAKAAFEEARVIRTKSGWEREDLSKEWLEEVRDFEKMLGDLEFSEEWQALLTLAATLSDLVERTAWVDRPDLRYDGERLRFLQERVDKRKRWLLLARHAAEARDYELSYHFYRRAGDRSAKTEVGSLWADQLLQKGHLGSALNVWRRLGEEDRVNALLLERPDPVAGDYLVFDSAALERQVSPACVRVSTPKGHQTGFFIEQGGFVMTCKSGLRAKGDEAGAITVVLESGERCDARILSESAEFDLALLKITQDDHELLPLGRDGDFKPGGALILFGFADPEKNLPSASLGTILKSGDEQDARKTSLVEVGSSPGHHGAPLVDQRGRVLGVALDSRDGKTRVLEIGAILKFLKKF